MDLSNPTVLATLVALIAVVAVAIILIARSQKRSSHLRHQFGEEYDRTLDSADSRRQAEKDLRAREKRVAKLDIHPLSVSQREHFIAAWQVIQSEFVDRPEQALGKADDLVTDVMRARGYPTDSFEERSADLSVDHPTVVQNYRAGRDIAEKGGDADTEDMRQAMIHFRALFDELVEEAVAKRRVS